ncbi:MAG: metal-dependent hydrolase [Gemmatimonadota bacterium]
MFLGHFAVAMAAKRAGPAMSLGTLFAAAQWPDLLWPVLLLLGVERVSVAPGDTAFTPLRFDAYPVSHSLVATLGWAMAGGLLWWLLRRDGRGAGLVAGLVMSHWLLDALTHRPDLQLAPWNDARVGLGLWNSVPATMALELLLFAAGVWGWLRVAGVRPRRRVAAWSLVAFLLVIYLMNVFGSPPPSAAAVAWVTLSMWLLVAWAWAADRAGAPEASRAGRPSEGRRMHRPSDG